MPDLSSHGAYCNNLSGCDRCCNRTDRFISHDRIHERGCRLLVQQERVLQVRPQCPHPSLSYAACGTTRKNITAPVTQIAWSPTADFVLWGDTAGSLCFLTESVPPGWTKPYPVAAEKEKSKGRNKAAELDAAAIWGDAEREEMNLDPDAALDPADDGFLGIDADDHEDDDDEDGADAALGLDYPELDRDEHYPREMGTLSFYVDSERFFAERFGLVRFQ